MKKRCNSRSDVAFLWDESYLWGLMAYDALNSLGLSFELVTSEEIRRGILRGYKLLFVPGGWASNKLKALGEKGVEEIKGFVYEGGNYFGICGGAGLATADGIGLLNIKRKPTKERVPSFSGPIHLNMDDHPIWKGIATTSFHAWWPSQFAVNNRDVRVIATFGDALPDAFSSDLNVGDIEGCCEWERFERIYGINLDPGRLKGEPAVVEGSYGKGKVLLSLIHFDTAGDEIGGEVLRNTWEFLTGSGNSVAVSDCKGMDPSTPSLTGRVGQKGLAIQTYRGVIESMVEELIALGIRNFLWFWRTPMLLQWRRGVRGLEYCTLYIMVKRLTMLEIDKSKERDNDHRLLLQNFTEFYEKARRLLVLERQAMQKGILTYEYAPDREIQSMREELFGNSKSHGGLFKKVLSGIDSILYEQLKSYSSGTEETRGDWTDR